VPSVRISGALPLLPHMPYAVRRDNLVRIARSYAAVAYLPSVVSKTWLAMPRGNSENSLQCFLPSPWSQVLVLKISTSYEMICFFFCFFWSRRVIIVFTRERHRPLSWAGWNHFTPFPAYFCYGPFYCYRLSTPRFSKQGLFRQGFPTKTSCALSSLSRLLHTLSISSLSLWSR